LTLSGNNSIILALNQIKDITLQDYKFNNGGIEVTANSKLIAYVNPTNASTNKVVIKNFLILSGNLVLSNSVSTILFYFENIYSLKFEDSFELGLNCIINDNSKLV